MVRLKDIARHAGVAVMTVSKALRDAPDVSTATKARIKALAQQMGYVPNSFAQGLRSQTSRIFGLVIPSITNPIFSRIVFAIEDRAHELGYDILLAHTHNLPEREEHGIRRLLSRRVDGLFISPVYRYEAEARIYQELLGRQTPVVLLGPRPFAGPSSAWRLRNWLPATMLHNTSSSSATNALPTSPARPSRPGRTNVSEATAAPCAKPVWKWTTSSSFKPAAPSRTAPRPRCK